MTNKTTTKSIRLPVEVAKWVDDNKVDLRALVVSAKEGKSDCPFKYGEFVAVCVTAGYRPQEVIDKMTRLIRGEKW